MSPRADPPPPLLSVRQAAARYGLHQETIRRWIRKRLLRCVYVGPYRAIRLTARDIETARKVRGPDTE